MSVFFDLIISLLACLGRRNNPRKGKSASQRCCCIFMTVTRNLLNDLIGIGQVNKDGPLFGNTKIYEHGVLQD